MVTEKQTSNSGISYKGVKIPQIPEIDIGKLRDITHRNYEATLNTTRKRYVEIIKVVTGQMDEKDKLKSLSKMAGQINNQMGQDTRLNAEQGENQEKRIEIDKLKGYLRDLHTSILNILSVGGYTRSKDRYRKKGVRQRKDPVFKVATPLPRKIDRLGDLKYGKSSFPAIPEEIDD